MGAQTKTNQSEGNSSVKLSQREAGNGPGGAITLDENVVATIAGMCARQVEGIYSLGRPRLIDFGGGRNRGVGVEVGEKQAAIDLDVVVEYGTDIQKCADELRDRMAREIARMANRELVEVNIHVADIHLPDDEEPIKPEKKPRVL